VLATPAKLASDWFAKDQRTLATSLSVMANYFGTGVGFLVALPIKHASQVRYVLYGEALFSIALLAMCVFDHVMFAPMPPLPPSASASTHRTVNILRDFKLLATNVNFVILTLSYGVCLGTYSGWSGVLDTILKPLHFGQNTASWLGFASTIGCVVGGVGFGHLGDTVKHVKPVLLLLFLASTAIFVWFTLLANNVISPSQWQLFLSCTLGRYGTSLPSDSYDSCPSPLLSYEPPHHSIPSTPPLTRRRTHAHI
jgi:MFS family permease